MRWPSSIVNMSGKLTTTLLDIQKRGSQFVSIAMSALAYWKIIDSKFGYYKICARWAPTTVIKGTQNSAAYDFLNIYKTYD